MFFRRASALFWAGMFVPPLACSVPFRVGQILFCNVYFDGVVVFLARIQLYYLHIDSNNIYLRVRSIVGIVTTYTSAMHTSEKWIRQQGESN